MWAFRCLIIFLIVFETFGKKLSESAFCSGSRKLSPVSCATHLWGENATSSDTCNMWFPGRKSSSVNNTEECAAMTFRKDGLAQIPELGRLKLWSYLGDLHGTTATSFNITFSDIRWKHLKFRFQQNNEKVPAFCREFTISSNKVVSKEIELFYDCIWSNSSIEQKAFNFEYQASDDTSTSIRRYLFNVPSSLYIEPTNTNLSQSELFMYIDLTHLPLLTLRLQMAVERFNVGPDKYLVYVHHINSYGAEEVPKKLEATATEEREISYEFDTRKDCGTYYFTAQIDHPNCSVESCFITKSPKLLIPSNSVKTILLIAIAGCGAAILALLYFAFFLWRRRKCAYKERAPTVLMIYAPTTTKHVNAVVELATYLNNFCHVEALLDELHIPKSVSKDPFTWCNDAFARSDFVMVLSSPFHNCSNYEGIYRNVDSLGLRLLKEKLCDRTAKQHFFSAVLPYCTDRDIPSEAKNLQKFILPKDFNKMLGFLHTKSTSFYSQFCVQPLVYGHGSEADLAREGSSLLRAMKMAGLELGNKSCVCNQSAHETPTLLDEFVTINLHESCNDLPLVVKREKRHISDDTFPGPIQELNLLGSEGEETNNRTSRKEIKRGAFDISSLDLG